MEGIGPEFVLKTLLLFVTDGLKFYKIALLKQYGKLKSFAGPANEDDHGVPD